jgi:hypothetical protein
MIQDNSILHLSSDTTYQDMGEGEPAVILQLSTGRLFTCNITTQSFLELMNGQRTFCETVDHLLESLDVTRDKLEHDLKKMAENLLAAGLIECS